MNKHICTGTTGTSRSKSKSTKSTVAVSQQKALQLVTWLATLKQSALFQIWVAALPLNLLMTSKPGLHKFHRKSFLILTTGSSPSNVQGQKTREVVQHILCNGDFENLINFWTNIESPGLVVVGLCFEGHGFESHHCILDEYFSH